MFTQRLLHSFLFTLETPILEPIQMPVDKVYNGSPFSEKEQTTDMQDHIDESQHSAAWKKPETEEK